MPGRNPCKHAATGEKNDATGVTVTVVTLIFLNQIILYIAPAAVNTADVSSKPVKIRRRTGHTPQLHTPQLNTFGKQGVPNTLLQSPSQTIGAIIRGYKSCVTKQFNLIGFAGQLWQRNYYDHIIKNEESYRQIIKYINDNPRNWKDDVFFRFE